MSTGSCNIKNLIVELHYLLLGYGYLSDTCWLLDGKFRSWKYYKFSFSSVLMYNKSAVLHNRILNNFELQNKFRKK